MSAIFVALLYIFILGLIVIGLRSFSYAVDKHFESVFSVFWSKLLVPSMQLIMLLIPLAVTTLIVLVCIKYLFGWSIVI